MGFGTNSFNYGVKSVSKKSKADNFGCSIRRLAKGSPFWHEPWTFLHSRRKPKGPFRFESVGVKPRTHLVNHSLTIAQPFFNHSSTILQPFFNPSSIVPQPFFNLLSMVGGGTPSPDLVQHRNYIDLKYHPPPKNKTKQQQHIFYIKSETPKIPHLCKEPDRALSRVGQRKWCCSQSPTTCTYICASDRALQIAVWLYNILFTNYFKWNILQLCSGFLLGCDMKW